LIIASSEIAGIELLKFYLKHNDRIVIPFLTFTIELEKCWMKIAEQTLIISKNYKFLEIFLIFFKNNLPLHDGVFVDLFLLYACARMRVKKR